MQSVGEYVGCKMKGGGMIEISKKQALRWKVNGEEYLKIYGGLRWGIAMEVYLPTHRTTRKF